MKYAGNPGPGNPSGATGHPIMPRRKGRALEIRFCGVAWEGKDWSGQDLAQEAEHVFWCRYPPAPNRSVIVPQPGKISDPYIYLWTKLGPD